MIEERKKIILDILDGSSSRLRESFFTKNNPLLVSSIDEFCINIDNITFKEKLWYWVNDIQVRFLCKCGNNTTFNKNWLDGYRKYCSPKCAQSNKLTKEKRLNTNLERYGVTNVSKSENIKKKIEDTNLERYGHKSSFQNEDVRKKWKENISLKYGVDHISQLDFVKDKRVKTIQEKYGVDNYTQTEEYKEKTLATNLEKYGKNWFTQTEEYKEKTLATNLERYGVEHYSKTDDFKERVSKTNLEKYGTFFYYQSDDFKNKSLKSNIERYGVEHYSKSDDYDNRIKVLNNIKYGVDWYYQSDDFKEKSQTTNLERYGVDHHSKSDLFKAKVIKTTIDRYGVDNYMKYDIYRKNNFRNTSNLNYLKYINNKNSLYNCTKGHTFSISSDNYIKRSNSGNPICTICYPIGDNKSIMEKELYDYINIIYEKEIIQSYRDGLEIDIYLPDLKIGFEFNGLYWHSEKYKYRNYHLDKTNHFKEKDIRIIHIWEDDWVFRNSITKSQICNLLYKSERKIYARNCYIKEIDSKTSISFLNNNHIQGKVNSSLKLGLYYLDELVSLMTFDHFEGRKRMSDNEWNINRFCNLINCNVIGGASKLFKYFICNYKPTRIISYADKDWSLGKLYHKLGFNNISESLPDYKYLVNGNRVHKSRYKSSKIKLKESEYVNKNGLFKIYDCGKIKFEFIN